MISSIFNSIIDFLLFMNFFLFFNTLSFAARAAFSLWLPMTAMICAWSGPTREISPRISKILWRTSSSGNFNSDRQSVSE